jgi:hypothetical protein
MDRYCTYFDRHYLARGLALYRSLRAHSRPFVLHVLCLDAVAYEALRRLGRPDLCPIALEEFEEGDGPLLAAKKNRTFVEYYFTCSPSLPLYLFRRHPDAELVTYLDADLFFYSDPAPIFHEMGDRSVLMIGHRFPPRLRHMERYGLYNVGFLAFRNNAEGQACLRWWRERCLEWCYSLLEDGRFADQKYLDEWPARFPGTAVLQHPGAGLAPWNVTEYELGFRRGQVFVDGRELIFFHFHRLKVVNRWLYDPGLETYQAGLHPVLRKKIYAPYLRTLRRCMKKVQSANGPDDQWVFAWRKETRSVFKGRMLLVCGPLSVPVHLEPLARGWNRVKAACGRRMRRVSRLLAR